MGVFLYLQYSSVIAHCTNHYLNHLKITSCPRPLFLEACIIASYIRRLKYPITRYNGICNKLRTTEIQWITYEKKKGSTFEHILYVLFLDSDPQCK